MASVQGEHSVSTDSTRAVANAHVKHVSARLRCERCSHCSPDSEESMKEGCTELKHGDPRGHQLRSGRTLELTYRNLLVAKSDEQPEHIVTMMLPASAGTQEDKDWVVPLSVEDMESPHRS